MTIRTLVHYLRKADANDKWAIAFLDAAASAAADLNDFETRDLLSALAVQAVNHLTEREV